MRGLKVLAIGGAACALAAAGGCLFDSSKYDLADETEEDGGHDAGSGAGGNGSGANAAAGGDGGAASGGGNGEGGDGGNVALGGSGGDGGDGGDVALGGSGGDGGVGPLEVTIEAGPNLALAIPDDSYDGTLGSMACVNLSVPAIAPNVVAAVNVAVAIDHTWVGDLTIKLRSPSGSVVTLMSMPGLVEGADNGSFESNESSNLVHTAPVLFLHGAPTSAESMGAGLTGTGVICQDDAKCTWAPSSGAALAGTLADLVGEPANGTWKVCVGDSVMDDNGTVEGVVLTIDE